MPSTPPPLYLDPQIDRLLSDRTLHKFDVLLNYAHTHGTYLLNDSQFRIFQITCETTKALDPILRELYSSTNPQIISAALQLHTVQHTHFQQASITYERIVTPDFIRLVNQEHYPDQIDSPPPIRIISPPRSPPPIPPSEPEPIASTSQSTHHPRRTRKQRLCYVCKQSSHQKRNCPKYRCQTCYHLAPGHLTLTCPNKPTPYSHHDDPQDYDQYYDYDPDDNLNGER